MSSNTAAASKPRAPKTTRAATDQPKAATPKPAGRVVPFTAPAAIAETIVERVPYQLLARAPENVRHTREAEDVTELADDIAAHGLLQSLIGYQDPTQDIFPAGFTWIVGGGRRLAALALLHTRGVIDDEYRVPVLIRDPADAIELSLAENLARRDMSPVDEFFAFEQLMKPGTIDAAGLAKRFGYTERHVKQRLRLAQLAPEILDALRDRKLTIDAAMAYASTSDQVLQREVFNRQAKKHGGLGDHSANSVRWAISHDAKTEAWPLFKFVGAKAYERAGGGYEEGLFDLEAAADGVRRLDNAFAVITQAHNMIDFQMLRLTRQWSDELDLGLQVVGYVKVKDLEFGDYHMAYHAIDKQAPDGFAWVGNDYNPDRVDRMLKTIRNNRILVKLPVGIDSKGELIRIPKGFFVPKDQAAAVDAPAAAAPRGAGMIEHRTPTPEERAAEQRARDVVIWSRRLAVGGFGDTKFAGRVFWPTYGARTEEMIHPTLGNGHAVYVRIFVSSAEADAQIEAAAEKLDAMEAERAEQDAALEAAEQNSADACNARAEEVAAMVPEPAVLIADDKPWYRWEDGSYADIPEAAEVGPDEGFDELTQMLAEVRSIGAAYASIEAYEAAVA